MSPPEHSSRIRYFWIGMCIVLLFAYGTMLVFANGPFAPGATLDPVTDYPGSCSGPADTDCYISVVSGSNTEIQYNDAGAMGSDADFIRNFSTGEFRVTGSVGGASSGESTVGLGNLLASVPGAYLFYENSSQTGYSFVIAGDGASTFGNEFAVALGATDEGSNSSTFYALPAEFIFATESSTAASVVQITPAGVRFGDGNGADYVFPIAAGASGEVLVNDGTGSLSWQAVSASASAAGADTQIQFNSGGAFAGDADFVWDSSSSVLTVKNTDIRSFSNVLAIGENTGSTLTGADSNILLIGHSVGNALDESNAINDNTFIGNSVAPSVTNAINSLLIGSNLAPTATGLFDASVILGQRAFFAGNSTAHSVVIGYNAAGSATDLQSNVLIGAQVAGTLTTGQSNVVIGANANVATATTSYAIALGNGATAASYEFALPDDITNWKFRGDSYVLPATDGAPGEVLGTDGAGNLSWTGAPAGSAGGSDTQVQFNDSGSFNGDSGFVFNKTTDVLTVDGIELFSPASQTTIMGSGAGSTSTSGASNTLLGYNAGNVVSSGSNNTLIGSNAGQGIGTGGRNTIIGSTSGVSVTSSDNTILGYAAGGTLFTGSNNTIIGGSANVTNSSATYAIALGSDAEASSYQFALPSNVTSLKLRGTGYTWPSADGSNGQALTTNGSGTLSWTSISNAAAGSDTYVQYNDGGILGADSLFSRTASTGEFFVGGDVSTGTTTSSFSIGEAVAGLTGSYIHHNGASNADSFVFVGDGSNLPSTDSVVLLYGNDSATQRAGSTLITANGVQLESVDDITSYTSTFTVTSSGISGITNQFSITDALSNQFIFADTGTRSVSLGDISGASSSTMLTVADATQAITFNYAGDSYTFPIGDGTADQFLKTNGSGQLSWGTPSTGAGGSNTQVQYNNGGVLAGDSGMTYDSSNNILTISSGKIEVGQFYIWNPSGSQDTFVGGGVDPSYSGNYNTLLGYHNATLTSGQQNTMIGNWAGKSITTGIMNTFLGMTAGNDLTTGSNNTFIGNDAGYSNNGSNNTFIGDDSGTNYSEGSGNTIVGKSAGGLTTGGVGSNNTFVGTEAGSSMTSGSRNILIGYQTSMTATADDQLNIGNSIFGDLANDYVSINDTTPDFALDVEEDRASSYVGSFFNDGNNDNRWGIQIQAGADTPSAGKWIQFNDGDGGDVGTISLVTGTLTLTTTSDERLKQNIQDTTLTINDLMGIKVRDYEFVREPGQTVHGFVAQELHQAFSDAVVVPDNPNEYWKVSYSQLTPLMVKSIQDLNVQMQPIVELASKITIYDETTLLAFLASETEKVINNVSLLVANILQADRVETQELCVGDTCITEQEFLEVFSNTASDSTTTIYVGSGESTDTTSASDSSTGTSSGTTDSGTSATTDSSTSDTGVGSSDTSSATTDSTTDGAGADGQNTDTDAGATAESANDTGSTGTSTDTTSGDQGSGEPPSDPPSDPSTEPPVEPPTSDPV